VKKRLLGGFGVSSHSPLATFSGDCSYVGHPFETCSPLAYFRTILKLSFVLQTLIRGPSHTRPR